MRPSGKSSPRSSKRITPLHKRLHPCSGWDAIVWAASRSGRSAEGHEGRCGHIAHLLIRKVSICCFFAAATASDWFVLSDTTPPASETHRSSSSRCRSGYVSRSGLGVGAGLVDEGVGPHRNGADAFDRERGRIEAEAARWQLIETAQVFDDRDARRKEGRMRRPAAVGLVVDVD